MYTFCDEKVHGSTTPSLQVSPDIGAESCSSIALIGNPILLLDACSAHLGPKFLASCVRSKIWGVCASEAATS